MAHVDIAVLTGCDLECADETDLFFALGLMHAVGSRADLVSAHKWFNLAAMRGHEGARRLRGEIAAEMSAAEIAAAQRAAREWLKSESSAARAA
jgi:hypothetical protein